MRIEIILFLITAAIIANVYTEGKLLKKAFTFKKYYQMAGIALAALFLYYVLKKNPLNAQKILATSSDYIKYLPIDKNTTSMLSPILDFTSKQDYGMHGGMGNGGMGNGGMGNGGMGNGGMYDGGMGSGGMGNGNMGNGGSNHQYNNQEHRSIERIAQSGKKSTKRSVSETKKKYVAARQNWKCDDCKNQLTAWFEVDHKIRLEYGGSNHIDNLVALCRECHGKKTTIENL